MTQEKHMQFIPTKASRFIRSTLGCIALSALSSTAIAAEMQLGSDYTMPTDSSMYTNMPEYSGDASQFKPTEAQVKAAQDMMNRMNSRIMSMSNEQIEQMVQNMPLQDKEGLTKAFKDYKAMLDSEVQ